MKVADCYEMYCDFEKNENLYNDNVRRTACATFNERNIFKAFDKVCKKIELKDRFVENYLQAKTAIESLDKSQRELLDLRYKNNLSAAQVAQLKNISIRTVMRKYEKIAKKVEELCM